MFRDAWLAAAQPTVQVAAVGAGTGKALSSMEPSGALDPAFTPTTARRHALLCQHADCMAAQVARRIACGNGDPGRLQANAVHLAAQLPEVPGGCRGVLYPASVKAGTDLQASTGAAKHDVSGVLH